MRENVTLPGGDMREGFSDMYVRTKGEFQSLDQIASTIVTMVDGRPIRVRDVAEVADGYEDINRRYLGDEYPEDEAAITLLRDRYFLLAQGWGNGSNRITRIHGLERT